MGPNSEVRLTALLPQRGQAIGRARGIRVNGTGPAGAFPWQWLVDGGEATGVQRFDSQYWRANVDPSERYVMSVVNSTKYRLQTDQSGFSNLFLTGDWIKTGLNAGCVEAAVMAGMQTSRAMTGHPAVIEGETDF